MASSRRRVNLRTNELAAGLEGRVVEGVKDSLWKQEATIRRFDVFLTVLIEFKKKGFLNGLSRRKQEAVQ